MMKYFISFREKTFDLLAVKYGLLYPRKSHYSLEEVIDGRNYEKKEQNKHKLLSFLLITVPDLIEDIIRLPYTIIQTIKDLIRYNITERLHIVKIGKPGYYDCDYRMQKAIINLFMEFIDGEIFEKPKQYFKLHINEKHYSKERRQGYRELEKAYFYFKTERKKLKNLMVKERENISCKPYKKGLYDKYWKLEKKLNDEDTKHLLFIVKNRNELWT